MPAGPVHLPKIKKDKGKGNDKLSQQQLKEELDLAANKNVFIDKQVIETVVADNKPDAANNSARKPAEPVKNRTVLYTISSL